MTGWWSGVVVASWAVPAASVAAYVPRAPAGGGPGMRVELDLCPDAALRLPDGRAGAVVSLVAQRCTNVRVLGVKWPGHHEFTSFYLRLCVRLDGRRGVTYVREVVPRRLIAWGGRRVYNQPCVMAPTETEVKQQTLLLGVEHRVHFPAGGLPPGGSWRKGDATVEHAVRAVGTKPASRPGPDSLEAWLTDRPSVLGMTREGKGIVYEVIHPSWGVHPVVDSLVRVDFAGVFGADWGFLSASPPRHVMLAVGSEVAVFPARESVAVRWGERRG